jgi:hypothetical protein
VAPAVEDNPRERLGPIHDQITHDQAADCDFVHPQSVCPRDWIQLRGSSWARQIERARHATNLLRQGVSILDTVHDAGYFDQAHLTRSLKHLIGQTPVEVGRGQIQLSFLYKTEPLP